MTKATGVVVVKENSFLTEVAVPPLALGLEEVIRIMCSSVSGFSNASWTPDPKSSGVVVGVGLLGLHGQQVKGLLELSRLDDGNKPLLNGGECSHLHDLLVATGEIALLVPASRSHSEGERSLQAGILLVAVVICAIVMLDGLEVRLRAVFLEKTESLLLLGLYKVLNVWGAVGTLLKLASDIDHAWSLAPGFQEVLRGYLRVVESPDHHTRLFVHVCQMCHRFL